MKVDVALIDRLSNLAKLRFEQDEKEDLAGKLESIIGFVDKLQEVPVQGIEPLIHMGDAVNVWRDDAVHMEITKEEALKNAPLADSDYFKVPKVLKKK